MRVEKQTDIVEKYKDSVTIMTMFSQVFEKMAKETGGEYEPAPLKHVFRALEKSAMQHEKSKRFDCSCVMDIVRGAVVYRSLGDFTKAARYLMDPKKSGFVVERFKDRLSEGRETSGGWRDAMFNGYLVNDEYKLRVEIQLHHRSMLLVRSDLGGHYIYAHFRSLIEALEVWKGKDYVLKRRKEYEEKVGKHQEYIDIDKKPEF